MTFPPQTVFSIHPTDFHGLVPRMAVKAGAEVKAGDVLFTDKKNPEIKFVSGIAGTVQEPVRGEKRRILRVDVVPSGSGVISGATIDPTQPDGDAVRAAMLSMGFWPMLQQRPFAVMPASDSTPRDIFVSGFDTAPSGAQCCHGLGGPDGRIPRRIGLPQCLASRGTQSAVGHRSG